MSDKTPPPAPDYAALAQRYLDLWQDQVAKLAKDPQDLAAMTQAWSRMAATMNPGGAYDTGPHRPAPATPPYGHGGVDRPGGHGGTDASANARLSAVEQRLAVLESRLASLAPLEPTSAKPAKPRPAGGGRGARKKP